MIRIGRNNTRGYLQVMEKECFGNYANALTPGNERNSFTISNLLHCVSLRKDALARHADSLMHKSAVSQGQQCLASLHNSGIIQALILKFSTIILTNYGLCIRASVANKGVFLLPSVSATSF